jgi:7-cyano-7-deazaguanine synthase
LDARPRLLEKLKRGFLTWRDRLGPDHVLGLDVLSQIGGSALTDDIAIELREQGLPTTFVPGRNLMFLTAAAALGYRRGIRDLVGGMCETDYSGYPDCRDATIKSMQQSLELGFAQPFVIHTPLMFIDKAETWRLAERLGGAALTDLIVEETVTCYRCAECPACSLRAAGYARYREKAA